MCLGRVVLQPLRQRSLCLVQFSLAFTHRVASRTSLAATLGWSARYLHRICRRRRPLQRITVAPTLRPHSLSLSHCNRPRVVALPRSVIGPFRCAVRCPHRWKDRGTIRLRQLLCPSGKLRFALSSHLLYVSCYPVRRVMSAGVGLGCSRPISHRVRKC